MLVRAILSVAGVLAIAACAAPGRYTETSTATVGGVTQQTTYSTDYVPAWAKPGVDHSNADHRAP